jgi:glycerol-3-phosphate dehydrogenase
MPGLLVSSGGKFTSARADAVTIVRRALKMLGRRAGASDPTRNRTLPWCPAGEPWEAWLENARGDGVRAGLDPVAAEAVARRYGAGCPGVFALVLERRELAQRIVPDLPFVRAEIVHAAASEAAVTLDDILRRRIPLVVLTPCGRGVLDAAARDAGNTLGWDPVRREKEVEATLERWGRA